jgi:hypothetical protein
MSAWSIIAETWHNTPGPVKTIVTAAFGTIVGAWLTSRSQEKRRIVEELKALHAAHSPCFSIVNRAFALKRQQVLPMKQRHDEAVAAYRTHQLQQQGLLEFQLDLQTLSQLKFPGELLEKMVFEKCGVGAKGHAAAISLTGAIDDLRNSIDYRNGLISDFRVRNAAMTELERIQFYVGAPGAGQIDNRFPHNIEALSKQTDDCIFFSMTLVDELLRRSDQLWARNWWKYRLGIPKLLPADWTMSRELGLIPDEADYVNWTGGFRRPPTRWERLRSWMEGLSVKSDPPPFQKKATRERPRLDILGGYRRRSKRPHSRFIAKED